MLDIKVIRENPEKVKASLNRRCKDYSADVDRVLELDARRRDIIGKSESIKAAQNAESKKIPLLKKAGEDTAPLFAELKKLADEIKELDAELKTVEDELNTALLVIPNTPNDNIPDGPDSSPPEPDASLVTAPPLISGAPGAATEVTLCLPPSDCR